MLCTDIIKSKISGSSSGGGDFFVAKITNSAETTLTLDKTFEEINEAYNGGKICFLLYPYGETIFSLESESVQEFVFSSVKDEVRVDVIVKPNQTEHEYKQYPITQALENTVTFKMPEPSNETFYIASCKGDSYISAPPNPTSTSGTFAGWLVDDEMIDFPYYPTYENEEAIAEFVTVRSEMEWKETGTWYTNDFKGVTYNKTNNEMCLIGHFYFNSTSNYGTVIIGETVNAIHLSTTNSLTSGTIEYDGKTYHYYYGDVSTSRISNLNPKSVLISNEVISDRQVATIKLLDHYFMKD